MAQSGANIGMNMGQLNANAMNNYAGYLGQAANAGAAGNIAQTNAWTQAVQSASSNWANASNNAQSALMQ